MIDAEYIPEVAQRYEREKKLRWPSTTYYNLANGVIAGLSSSCYYSYQLTADSESFDSYYAAISWTAL